jgi:hypothetical protein
MAADPACTDPDKYQVIFENDRVRVLEYRDLPGDKTRPHEHPDSVMYTLSAFQRRLHVGQGRAMSSWNRAAPTGCQPRPTRARTPAPRLRTCCSSSSRRQEPPGRFTAAAATAGMPRRPGLPSGLPDGSPYRSAPMRFRNPDCSSERYST